MKKVQFLESTIGEYLFRARYGRFSHSRHEKQKSQGRE